MELIQNAIKNVRTGDPTSYKNLTGAALIAKNHVIHLSAFAGKN